MSRRKAKRARNNDAARRAATQMKPLVTTSTPEQVKTWGMKQANRATVLDFALCLCVGPLMIPLGYLQKPSVLDQVGSPFREIWASLMLGAIVARILSYQEMIFAREMAVVRRMLRLRIAVAITVLTVIFFPPLYLSPFPERVSTIIISIAPSVGDRVAASSAKVISFIVSGVSGAIANVLLGIVGNFVYDLLKSHFKNREARRAQ